MLSAINNSETLSQKNSSWCVASINEIKNRVKITHIERGRFKVISDEEGDRYIENIILDASDIFHCKE
jgi:hypothetical protein